MVSKEEAIKMAETLKIEYYEASAKSGENIQFIFDKMGKDLLK